MRQALMMAATAREDETLSVLRPIEIARTLLGFSGGFSMTSPSSTTSGPNDILLDVTVIRWDEDGLLRKGVGPIATSLAEEELKAIDNYTTPVSWAVEGDQVPPGFTYFHRGEQGILLRKLSVKDNHNRPGSTLTHILSGPVSDIDTSTALAICNHFDDLLPPQLLPAKKWGGEDVGLREGEPLPRDWNPVLEPIEIRPKELHFPPFAENTPGASPSDNGTDNVVINLNTVLNKVPISITESPLEIDKLAIIQALYMRSPDDHRRLTFGTWDKKYIPRAADDFSYPLVTFEAPDDDIFLSPRVLRRIGIKYAELCLPDREFQAAIGKRLERVQQFQANSNEPSGPRPSFSPGKPGHQLPGPYPRRRWGRHG